MGSSGAAILSWSLIPSAAAQNEAEPGPGLGGPSAAGSRSGEADFVPLAPVWALAAADAARRAMQRRVVVPPKARASTPTAARPARSGQRTCGSRRIMKQRGPDDFRSSGPRAAALDL